MNGIGIQVRILGLMAIGTVCSLIACSGGGSSTGTILPASTGTIGLTLKLEVPDTNALDTVAVAADVSGTTNTSVNWSVDAIPHGNATVGTISGSGTMVTYIAPASAGTHTITATSLADTSKSASFSINVKAPAMTVSVSPTTADVAAGASVSLTATISGSRHNSVRWSVDGVTDGNASIGTLSGSGNAVIYAAPPSPGTHAVSVISIANPEVNATASVTVQAPAPVQVSLAPVSAALVTAGSLSFTATVSSSTNTAVTWTVDDIIGGNATVGTLTGTGNTAIYTAPVAVGTHTLKATSVADASKSASSVISVQTPVQVALSPGATPLASAATLTFSATVTGSTNTAVTWLVDTIAGGNTAVGTITGTGSTAIYTAPAVAGAHTVMAVSAADTSKTASTIVTVQAPVQVSLSPGTTTLASAATLSFSATVTGSTNTAVTWLVDSITGGNNTVGTITGTGSTAIYTAPTTTGTHTVMATSAADTSKTASTIVTIQAPVQVSLSPGATTLASSGALSFSATVTGPTNTAVTWLVDAIAGGNATVGIITGTGTTVTYTASSAAGIHTIKATSVADASKSASSIVTVQAPVQVSLSPGATTLATGATLSFTSTVINSTNPSVTWTVDDIIGGNITVGALAGTGATATYTAPTTVGNHTIKATSMADASKSASSIVSVQAPDQLSLSPGATTLGSAATLSFTATMTGTTNPAVTWVVDSIAGGNAAVGTLTGTGTTVIYTAPVLAGTHTIKATSVADASKVASAVVTVLAPVQVSLSPGTTTLASSAALSFTATMTGSTNTAVTWTVDDVSGGNATVGTLTGTGSTTIYTAPIAAGTHTIKATSVADATKSASSVVTIQAPIAVSLSPGATTLTTAGTLSFTATVTGSTNTALTWVVDNIASGNATVGTITGTGASVTYTAPATSGAHTVMATSAADTSKSASSVVTVQAPVQVSLAPGATTLASAATLPFTATVTGSTNTAVAWAVDTIVGGNSTVGVITGTGATATYAAPSAAGTHTIKATSVADAAKSASTVVTVQAPIQVTLSPGATTLASAATQSFTAAVTGSSNTAVTWMVDAIAGGNSTVGTITGTGPTVTYTGPTAAGTHTVKATSAADTSKNASTVVTVLAPVLVTASPTLASLSTGATVSITATVSGTTNTAVTWTVDALSNGNSTVGTITGSGNTVTYTAPTTAGSHSVVATSVADTRKTISTAITVLPPAPIAVTINPSSGSLSVSTSTSFTASVTGTTNTAVSWSVDGVANGNTSVGTITGSGNTITYSAPPSSGTYTVKAASVQDSSKFITASVVVGSLGTVDLGALAAFPGCEGMGSGATGGRGGDVYTVNTLADTTNSGCVPQNGPNGPICSLRDVMLKSGPRTAVFSVSGTITLTEAMYPTKRGLTIAGQTAPGGGIQVRGNGTFGTGGSMLWLNGNSIVRYIRIRPGNAPVNASYQGLTGMGISMDQTDDVVVDHCSYEWDGNKAAANWSINGLRRNTFSWNILAECMAPHSTGMLIGGDPMGQANMDISSWDGHHNVLASIDHRLPQTWFKYGRWINNYVFGYYYAMLVRGGTNFDIIGNVWDGIDSNLHSDPAKQEVRWADTYAHNENQIVPGGTAQIYMSNNFGPHNPLGTLDNFSTMLRIASCENCQLDNNPVDTQFKATGPTIPSSLNTWPITITHLSTKEDLKNLLAPAVGAYQRLAPDGSWVANRDSVDARIIAYILNPTTSPTTLVTTAGPYPDLSGGAPYVDSDGDGMPDIWEDAHGLNKNDPSDRNIIRPNAHGYTNLELYLSGLFPNGTPLP